MITVSEMAENHKEVVKILRSSSVEELVKHIIKLVLFDSPQNKNHRKTEVYSNFHDLPLMKHNKRPPDERLIFDTIWNYFGDRLNYITDAVIREKSNEKIRHTISNKQIYAYVLAYIRWLSKELSIKTTVSKQEVYDKLDSLGL